MSTRILLLAVVGMLITAPAAFAYPPPPGGANATRIQSVPVSSTTPTTNQVLKYNGSAWAPAAVATGTVTSVSGSAPISVATGTTTPAISITDGAITNAKLQTPSVTISTTSPLAGGGSLSLGATLTLTCATCVTTARLVSSGTGLSGGGDLSADRTLSIDSTVVTLTGSQALSNKTLTTPTIASFTNATHGHQDAAGGGSLDAAAIGSGTIASARLAGSGATIGPLGFLDPTGSPVVAGTCLALSTYTPAAAVATGKISGDWFNVGVGAGNVVMQVWDITAAGEVCNCTLGACTTATTQAAPLVCTCTGTIPAAHTVCVRVSASTNCAVSNPAIINGTVALTQ